MAFFHKKLLPYYGLFILIGLLCGNHIFFWDTYQLCGRQAWALYDNGLFNWILPPEIDSGHPPLFGFYHAVLWKIFGPKLMVSHLAMLPFLLGIVYLLFKIGSSLLGESKAVYLLPLLIVDPVFMGQAVLVSPDIILIFFMLLSLLGILKERRTIKWIGALGLGMISMRGMMVLASLVLYEFFYVQRDVPFKRRCLQMGSYVPAVVTVFFFLAIHYMKTGWMGHHEDSSWANAFKLVNINGLMKNIAVYGWRLLDFGRVFLILPLIWLGYQQIKSKARNQSSSLLALLFFLILILSPILLIHQGLLLHRYMLPIFLLISILFWYLLMSSPLADHLKKLIFGAVIAGLFIGNFWVYPKKISQGWDATLGHLPYYHLRDKMYTYIDQQDIAYETIGTAFPNIGDLKNFDPQNRRSGILEYDFERNGYIFYSNIYNDFTDEEIDILESDKWGIEKEYHFYPVCLILYKKAK